MVETAGVTPYNHVSPQRDKYHQTHQNKAIKQPQNHPHRKLQTPQKKLSMGRSMVRRKNKIISGWVKKRKIKRRKTKTPLKCKQTSKEINKVLRCLSLSVGKINDRVIWICTEGRVGAGARSKIGRPTENRGAVCARPVV